MFEEYNGKKIAVLGFGIEGKATFQYLKARGLKPAIIDRQDKGEFLKDNPNYRAESLFLGEEYLQHIKDFDVIFKTPGISPLQPEIILAKKNGIIFTSQIEEFFKYCPSRIVGVTGTKGKGTTSTLIRDILKNSKLDVYLGGNIGVPAISFLDKLKTDSIVVLELSSFQLQVLSKSPNLAVVLMVTSEHLDYHASTEEYREAKKNIVKYQDSNDLAVINTDYSGSLEIAGSTKAKKYYVSKTKETNGCFVNEKDEVILKTPNSEVKLIDFADLLLRGRHNLENVVASCMASYLLDAPISVIQQSLKEFKGLEHRLEFVSEVGGVRYYNDSISTVPETAIAAIDSFVEPKILILGGSYKGSDYTQLGKKIADSNVKAVILIGEMAEEINRKISEKYKGDKILGITDMKEVVSRAVKLAQKGDVVLLSPACASFGLFKNYKDRGDQFKEQVLAL